MTIYQIKPITIAAGDCVPMKYNFVNADGTTPDLTEFTGYFVLSPYGFENENKLKKEMTLVTDSTCVYTVNLTTEDTIALEEGAYTSKIILECDGNYYKKARGVFNVLKDSEDVEVTM